MEGERKEEENKGDVRGSVYVWRMDEGRGIRDVRSGEEGWKEIGEE